MKYYHRQLYRHKEFKIRQKITTRYPSPFGNGILCPTDVPYEVSSYPDKLVLKPKNQVYKLVNYHAYNQRIIRELIFDNSRLAKYAGKPSRFSCFYIMDEDGIDYWYHGRKDIEGDARLYEVEFDEKICKYHIGYDGEFGINMEKSVMDWFYIAERYWNGENVGGGKEILVEGELIIKKMISSSREDKK